MKPYRKKPVVIQAEQWRPGKDIEGVSTVMLHVDGMGMPEWLPTTPAQAALGTGIYKGNIKTLEDVEGSYHWVDPGDYVIIGVAGERYACKPDIFHQTYEEVKE